MSAEEEWITTAQKLAAENNGKLPTAAWLKKNGYCGLVLMLTRFPDKFNMPREMNVGKTIDCDRL